MWPILVPLLFAVADPPAPTPAPEPAPKAAPAAPAAEPVPDDTPPFFRAMIVRVLASPATNPPTRILRYQWRDQPVYYVPPRCCDIPGVVYDAKGTHLCAPTGGFVASGDGKCPEFFEQRRDEQLVWRDVR